jgi:hypothetical protein
VGAKALAPALAKVRAAAKAPAAAKVRAELLEAILLTLGTGASHLPRQNLSSHLKGLRKALHLAQAFLQKSPSSHLAALLPAAILLILEIKIAPPQENLSRPM